MGRLKIVVDSDLEEFFPKFLRNKESELVQIVQALGRGDFESIQRIGHGLKGSSAGFGMNRLGEIGAAIEGAAQRRDVAGIRTQHQLMKQFLLDIDVEFRPAA